MEEQEKFLIKMIVIIAIMWLVTIVILGQAVINRNEEIHDLKTENNKLTNIIESNLVEKVEGK